MFHLMILRTTLTNITVPVMINEKYVNMSTFVLIFGTRHAIMTANIKTGMNMIKFRGE